MNIVSLHGLEFYAFHGYHAEEQKTGNRFIVDIDVETNFEKAAQQDDLAATVDYTVLFDIINTEMQNTQKLLESVANSIISKTYTVYPFIKEVSVKIKKLNPPFPGACDYSQIWIKKIN